VPRAIGSLAGIDRFGSVIYRRRQLSRRVADAAVAAGIDRTITLSSPQDAEELRDRLVRQTDGNYYLYFPSNLVTFRGEAELAQLLSKLRYAGRNVRIDATQGDGSWTGLLLLRRELFSKFSEALADAQVDNFLSASDAGSIAPVDNSGVLADLRHYASFISYLTSNFEVRHFNSVTPCDLYTVVKRSTNREKIRLEYDYYNALPENVQRYFVRPFAFEETATHASYRMERLQIPDVALQWIHGSLSGSDFRNFLDQVFYYLALRPVREASVAQCRAAAAEMYLDKLQQRFEQLRVLPSFGEVDARVTHGGSRNGIAGLLEDFKRLYETLERRRHYQSLALGHGDLCFSNILYEKGTQLMKLVDQRGAADPARLYTDDHYDLAKLSHSIFGLYDFINNDLFDLKIADDLSMCLEFDDADRKQQQQMFAETLAEKGYDLELVRLYEASLFLSMLPLHSEGPRKMVAFAMTAAGILRELGGANE
jgi:hypothetical protein